MDSAHELVDKYEGTKNQPEFIQLADAKLLGVNELLVLLWEVIDDCADRWQDTDMYKTRK